MNLEDPAPGPSPISPPLRIRIAPRGFFELLVIGYLIASGAQQTWIGIQGASGGMDWSRDEVRSIAWPLAVGLFSLLLSAQLWFRIPIARLSVSILFLLQLSLRVHESVIQAPETWLLGSPAFRLQQLAEILFWALATIGLLTRPWSTTMHHPDDDPRLI